MGHRNPRIYAGVPVGTRDSGGGLIPGRPYLVTGEDRRERRSSAFVSWWRVFRRVRTCSWWPWTNRPTEILENVQSFGWDLSASHARRRNPGTHGLKRAGGRSGDPVLGNLKSMGTPWC